jgi:hypothetical protein
MGGFGSTVIPRIQRQLPRRAKKMARIIPVVVVVCASMFLSTALVCRSEERKPAPEAAKAQADLPSIDTIIARTEDKMKDVQDIVADLRMTASVPGLAQPVTVVGSLKCLSPGMFLMEGKTAKTPDSNEEPSLKAIKIVLKGGIIHTVFESPEKGKTTCIKMDYADFAKIKKEYADVPDFKMETPRLPDYIHYLKNEKSGGATLKVLSVRDNLATVECNSPDSGWVVKTDTYRDGVLDSTIELSNVRTNTGLNEKEFEFTPPADIKVLDAAKMFRGMAESSRKWAERQKEEKKAKE